MTEREYTIVFHLRSIHLRTQIRGFRDISSVIRQKGNSQNGGNKKTKRVTNISYLCLSLSLCLSLFKKLAFLHILVVKPPKK